MPAESKTTTFLIVLAIVAVLGVIVVSTFKAAQPITVNTGDRSPERDILTVSGTHELEVAPDEAMLTFAVVTQDPKAATASDNNRVLMRKVVAALKQEGVTDDEIETTDVTLTKVTEWDYKNQVQVDKGYQQTTTVRVTMHDLTKVGGVLDAAVQAGANNVQDVTFRLTPASEEKYKQQALTEAAKVAKQKAQILADASGATLGKITSVSEQSYYQPYYYNTRSVAFDMAKGVEAAATPTPISPEKVTISATVNIGYALN